MSRPSKFNQSLADLICEKIADGESLVAICRDDAMPARSTVFKWLSEQEEFSDRYASAREAQGDKLFDEIVAIADEQPGTTDQGATDSGMVADKRLRVDARKWVASKLAPKKYGDKQQVDIGNADGKPFATSDADAATKLAAIITAGLARKAADVADLV